MADKLETLDQLKARRTAEIIARHGVTADEVDELYDEIAWYGEWWDDVVLPAAREGRVIDADSLDTLAPHNRRYIVHDYWRSVPPGYVLPECR